MYFKGGHEFAQMACFCKDSAFKQELLALFADVNADIHSYFQNIYEELLDKEVSRQVSKIASYMLLWNAGANAISTRTDFSREEASVVKNWWDQKFDYRGYALYRAVKVNLDKAFRIAVVGQTTQPTSFWPGINVELSAGSLSVRTQAIRNRLILAYETAYEEVGLSYIEKPTPLFKITEESE